MSRPVLIPNFPPNEIDLIKNNDFSPLIPYLYKLHRMMNIPDPNIRNPVNREMQVSFIISLEFTLKQLQIEIVTMSPRFFPDPNVDLIDEGTKLWYKNHLENLLATTMAALCIVERNCSQFPVFLKITQEQIKLHYALMYGRELSIPPHFFMSYERM